MEIEQSSSINKKSHEEIVNENEETKEKKRYWEYQRAWHQRKKDLKKKDSKEEKEEKRKRHRENQRAYYQRTKGLKENDKNVEELSQKKLDDLQMKRKKLDSNEDQENVVQCRASQNLENVQLEQNQFLTQQLRFESKLFVSYFSYHKPIVSVLEIGDDDDGERVVEIMDES